MAGKRMSEKMAAMEIFMMFLRGIRSVFFNLFMLGLGFVLGFGAYSHLHKIVDSRGHRKLQEWVSGTNVSNRAISEKT